VILWFTIVGGGLLILLVVNILIKKANRANQELIAQQRLLEIECSIQQLQVGVENDRTSVHSVFGTKDEEK